MPLQGAEIVEWKRLPNTLGLGAGYTETHREPVCVKLRSRKRRLKVTGVAMLVASVPGQGYLGERHKGYVWGEGLSPQE